MEIYLFALILGFLVGSLPTTYLLIKWRKKLDIRKEGTGNVGTMNVYEVTNSRALGFLVLGIDIIKAAVAVLVARWIFGDTFWIMGIAGIGATLGHNYSPWLGFKGGRGLATTLGVSIVLGWVIAAAWMISFVGVYLVKRDIHTGNLIGSILMPILLALIPGEVIRSLTWGASPTDILILSICMAVLILLGHYGIIKEILKPSANHMINPPANKA